MIKSLEPVVIMTQAELDAAIHQAAKTAVAEAMKSMPAAGVRPLHVTQTQAAEMMRRSRSSISKLVKAGTLRLNEIGMIPVDQIDRAMKCVR